MHKQLLTTAFAALLALAFVLCALIPGVTAEDTETDIGGILYAPDITLPRPSGGVLTDEPTNVETPPESPTVTPETEEVCPPADTTAEPTDTLPLPELPTSATPLCLYINGRAMPSGFAAEISGSVYIPIEGFGELFGVDGLSAKAGDPYISYADRCIPCSFSDISVCVLDLGVLCAPVEALAAASGMSVTDTRDGAICIWGAPTFPTADGIYSDEDLYWMSRIISAEAGIEPFLGQLAVGTVVINRTRSAYYPETVYGVVFDRLGGVQFTPVASGTIYKEPTASAVLAAKLCLEGYCLDESILFFFNSSIATGSWIVANRTYMMTVGRHDFYS